MRADAKKNYDDLLAVALVVVGEQGANASLREIARRAGVGLPTLYRHFSTREALLEALLRTGFDDLTAKARNLETSDASDDALLSWLRETVAVSQKYHGVTTAMMAAIDDPNSALHASCVMMRAAGTRLLARAQADGMARVDISGADLFALIAALAWLGDQPAVAQRADHLFGVIASAILPSRASVGCGVKGRARAR
jgi:AcrR family transcriptional regulator